MQAGRSRGPCRRWPSRNPVRACQREGAMGVPHRRRRDTQRSIRRGKTTSGRRHHESRRDFWQGQERTKIAQLFCSRIKKTFLGEPYERVMAYYYRGILYWMDGEPDNARACFRSAQLQDSDTVDKTYASDYALLDYLDGLASLKLGADGSDAFKRAGIRNSRITKKVSTQPAARSSPMAS